jgi:hypothetical protein
LNQRVDRAVDTLRGFVAKWSGAMVILEDLPTTLPPSAVWDAVGLDGSDREHAAKSFGGSVSAWSRERSDLGDLQAVATMKGISLPEPYLEFMARYGSLTLIALRLPSSPLAGLGRLMGAGALLCLLRVLPADEIRHLNTKPSKLLGIGYLPDARSTRVIYLDWRTQTCLVRAWDAELGVGDDGFVPGAFGSFDAWFETAVNAVIVRAEASLEACADRLRARRSGLRERLSLRPTFERATSGRTGADLVDATVAALRDVVREHPRALLLIEELGPDPRQNQGRIAVTLGASPDEYFLAYHHARSGAWQRMSVADAAAVAKLELATGKLPPSYRHFLDRYGSLTLLANRLSPWLGGFWAGNVSSHGWSLLQILDATEALEITEYIRAHGKSVGFDLSRLLVIHGAWMARGFALHLGARNQHDECAIQHVSDDAIGNYSFKKLSRRQRVATDFATWLANETGRVLEQLEIALPRLDE